mmetsp:Transcript_3974/g.5934  ORF Transcript_3974/g.5934 Transcript_3974/m.5934 type:complete len:80 (-) Transcript_3974:9-248(-)
MPLPNAVLFTRFLSALGPLRTDFRRISITIPTSVNIISDYAFRTCSKVTSCPFPSHLALMISVIAFSHLQVIAGSPAVD